MSAVVGKPISHAAILFLHDDKQPLVINVKDVLCEDKTSFQPKDAADFVAKKPYLAVKRCPPRCSEKHKHSAHRRAFIVVLSDSREAATKELGSLGKRLPRVPQRYKSSSPLEMPAARGAPAKRKRLAPSGKENDTQKQKRRSKEADRLNAQRFLRMMENDQDLPSNVFEDSSVKLRQAAQQSPVTRPSPARSSPPPRVKPPRRTPKGSSPANGQTGGSSLSTDSSDESSSSGESLSIEGSSSNDELSSSDEQLTNQSARRTLPARKISGRRSSPRGGSPNRLRTATRSPSRTPHPTPSPSRTPHPTPSPRRSVSVSPLREQNQQLDDQQLDGQQQQQQQQQNFEPPPVQQQHAPQPADQQQQNQRLQPQRQQQLDPHDLEDADPIPRRVHGRRRRRAINDANSYKARMARILETALQSQHNKLVQHEGQNYERGQALPDRQIILGLGRTVAPGVWALHQYKKANLHLNFLITVMWTEDVLSLSCLDGRKLKNPYVEGQAITELPEDELQLLYSLYNDFLLLPKKGRDGVPFVMTQKERAVELKAVSTTIGIRCRDSRLRQ